MFHHGVEVIVGITFPAGYDFFQHAEQRFNFAIPLTADMLEFGEIVQLAYAEETGNPSVGEIQLIQGIEEAKNCTGGILGYGHYSKVLFAKPWSKATIKWCVIEVII